MAVPILRLNVDDNPIIIVKQDTTPITYTGWTVNLVGSGDTIVTGSGANWIIYSSTPTGNTWGSLSGSISNQTDLWNILTGQTADIATAQACCTGNTAAIDYHYQQFTAFTDYFSTLIIPAITGNTQNISDLSGAFQNHTGNTLIHFEKTDISYNDLQDLPTLFSGDYDDLTNKPDLSIYLTGYTVTADDVTGITASLYAPIVHTHAYSAITDTPDLSVYQPVSGMSAYLTGVTWNDVINKPDLTLQSDFTGHTSDLTIHYPQSGISITESQISDFGDYALESDFTGHTSDLTIHYPQSGISITESQISDLQAYTLTGTTQALSDAFDSHTGNTDIHFEKTDISYNDLQDLPSLFSGDYDDLTNKPDLSVYQPVSGMSAYLTGVTWNDVTNKPDLTLQSDFTGHTSDLTIHYPQSGISITESQISDLQAYTLTGTTQALSDAFDSHTGDTTIHFVQSAITITESQISNLQDYALESDLTGHTSDLTIHYQQSAITITESQVTNLVEDLAAKSDTGHTHSYNNLTDLPDLNAYTLTGTTAALQSAINTYTGTTAPASFLPITGLTGYWTSAQTESYVTGLGYITGYTVTADDVTGITASLYSPIGHTHPYSAITDTPDLNAYALSGHTHSYNNLTDLPDLNAYTLTGTTAALQSAFDTYTGTTAPASFLPITGLTGYWTSAQTENYVTGLGYLTGITSVGSGTTVLKTASEIKSLTATNLTLNAQTNEVNIEAGSIAPKDFWTGTEAEYAALGSYDANTLYFCTA